MKDAETVESGSLKSSHSEVLNYLGHRLSSLAFHRTFSPTTEQALVLQARASHRRHQVVSLWEVTLFQSTNLVCCVLQFLKLTRNPNKNMADVELRAEDTVSCSLRVCSLSKLAALLVLLPFFECIPLINRPVIMSW